MSVVLVWKCIVSEISDLLELLNKVNKVEMSIKKTPIPLPRTKTKSQDQVNRKNDSFLASSDSEKYRKLFAHHGNTNNEADSNYKYTQPLFNNVLKEFSEKFVPKEVQEVKNNEQENEKSTKEDLQSIDREHATEQKFDKTEKTSQMKNFLTDLANGDNIKLDFSELKQRFSNNSSRNAVEEPLYENVTWLRSISDYNSCSNIDERDKCSVRYDNVCQKTFIDEPSENNTPCDNKNVYQYSLNHIENNKYKSKENEHIREFSFSQKSLKYSKSDVSCSSGNSENAFMETVSNLVQLGQVSESIEEHIMKEMIRTEEIYVASLQLVVKNYLPYLYTHAPENLNSKIPYIFGNIEQIYDESQKFLELLKENSGSIDKMTSSFIQSPNRFDLYAEYSKNKPLADEYFPEFNEIVRAREVELNDHLGLASHLLCPIQRLGKYVLMLENVQKTLKKSNKSTETSVLAKTLIKNVMRKSNDFIAIDSIKDCEIDLFRQGSFIMRTPFNILKPRRFQSMVFLFDDVIIFTERVVKHVEQFQYVDSIKMTDLKLRNSEDKSIVFYLTDYEKLKKNSEAAATYVLETDKQKIKDDWINVLEKKLWSQFHEVKENRSKIEYKDPPLFPESLSPTTERKARNFDKKTANATFYVYNRDSELEAFVNKNL